MTYCYYASDDVCQSDDIYTHVAQIQLFVANKHALFIEGICKNLTVQAIQNWDFMDAETTFAISIVYL